MDSPLPRKLSVILHADVVGYSRLAGVDEDDTHRRLKVCFSEIFDTVSTYDGRVANTAGDAILAVFDAATDAVYCAIAIQKHLNIQNKNIPVDRKLLFRIGINLGDVIEEEGNVFGDGVNIAARLESLADVGGVVISDSVYSVVRNKLPLDFIETGQHKVKNIDAPITVISIKNPTEVKLPERAAKKQTPPTDPRTKNQTTAIVAVSFVAIVAAVMWWVNPWSTFEKNIADDDAILAPQGKLSIAVLPFSNMNGSSDEDYFADGITEDLITDLSKSSDLLVIARNTAFTYKNKSMTVNQVAQELNVDYVLEGSVRRADNQVRINAQLVDVARGGHLWADRYDGRLENIFQLQDQVTEQIVNALSIKLTTSDNSIREDIGTQNPEAHDAYLQGLSFYLRNTPGDNAKAEPYFIRATKLDPDFKRAYAALAKVYYKASNIEYGLALGLWTRKAIFLAHVNLVKTAGVDFADVHVVRSQMALSKHQVDIALKEARLALKISPNHVDALKAESKALIYLGKFDAGSKIAESIMRLDPAALAEPLYLLGLSEFAQQNYQKASEYVARAIENDPKTNAYNLLLAASQGQSRQFEKAKSAWATFQQKWMFFDDALWIAAAVYLHPFEQETVLQNFADGLKAAGAAERPPSLFLKLDGTNRLDGEQISQLVLGGKLRGEDFWRQTLWTQDYMSAGKVRHTGEPIHVLGHKDYYDEKVATSSIVGNRLCLKWFFTDTSLTICEQIFRNPDAETDSYYMVTDTGPHSFHVISEQ